MPTRSIPIVPGYFYHIYNRGNNRQHIFRNAWDFQYFRQQIAKYFKNADISTVAYCLMPTHFHLLVTFLSEINFANVMRSLSVSYVKFFHLRHGTSGHLFEDDYQAKQVASDGNLINLISYIHLNPVEAAIAANPWDWKFSDCNLWCFEENPLEFGHVGLRSSLFAGAAGYRDHLEKIRNMRSELKRFMRDLEENPTG